ncbi:speckle-type POZ protein-like [Aphidius gifuensis]|uniref:speckle-type POZ protein-like n=1 Tax=Aphidius gifuensis TaxID=684658 RepID=UPI001CDCC3F3|nr:speckle-type POZ protein-like [Aphidius gifuensis]
MAVQLEHPPSSSMHISGETSFQEIHLHYEWKILNFREMFNTSRTGCILESSRFSFRDDQQDQWYLELYPRGDMHKPTFMLMAIKLTQKSYDEMPMDFLSGIISMNVFIGRRRPIHLDDICIEECYPDNNNYIRIMTLYDLCEAPHEIFPQNILIINCNIVIKAIIHQQTLMIHPLTSQHYAASNNNHALKCERKFTDVVFNVDGIIIHAHKFILGSRSSIFQQIFENQLIENSREYVIQITDIKVNVFNQLLEYIYTNNAPRINDNLDDLIIAADKYQNLSDIDVINVGT